MDQQDIIKYTCTCKVKTKKEEKVCGKQAKYKNTVDGYYCTQHANSNKTLYDISKGSNYPKFKKEKSR